MSKGSGRRPQEISDEEMQRRWEQAFGKPICVLTSNSTDKDRHYEEAGSISDEMRLHQEKMRRASDVT